MRELAEKVQMTNRKTEGKNYLSPPKGKRNGDWKRGGGAYWGLGKMDSSSDLFNTKKDAWEAEGVW